MSDTKFEDHLVRTLAQAERGLVSEKGASQFELALRRVKERGCTVDPEAPVGAFQSAF